MRVGRGDEDSAVDAVAAALAIDGRPGVGLIERVAAVLADDEVVLLLDNCEHVLDPIAGLVEALLARCPNVAVVATSRERLRVGGERLCTVPTLRSTGDDAPAVELFVDRARAVAPGFDPEAAELSVVAEIVRRLDGLPLAIELAAARLHTLDVAEVAAGLDRRFELLSVGSRTSSRHGSLNAAVSWSYGLLDEATATNVHRPVGLRRHVHRRRRGGHLRRRQDRATAAALDQLVERSLVMRAPDRRYVMLETLRAFGAEQRAADGGPTSYASATLITTSSGSRPPIAGAWSRDATERSPRSMPRSRNCEWRSTGCSITSTSGSPPVSSPSLFDYGIPAAASRRAGMGGAGDRRRPATTATRWLRTCGRSAGTTCGWPATSPSAVCGPGGLCA